MGIPDVDYRALYGKEYLGSWDLQKPVTLTIRDVQQGELRNDAKKSKDKRPIIYFERTDKALVLNATNGKTIAKMYGTRVRGWIGKRITVYATTCDAFGQTVDCIRVKPQIPAARTRDTEMPAVAPVPTAAIDATVGEAAFDPSTGEVSPDREPSDADLGIGSGGE